jgi:FkbM family methyltransferase
VRDGRLIFAAMETQLGRTRQRVQTVVGRILPPAVSLPLRARLGGSREPELAILPELVRPGDVAVDVGAHRGVYTYHLARIVGPSGHVVAYEPQPAMADYLRAASRRGLLGRRVDLRARALSDREGTAVLSVPVEDGHRVIGQATLRDVGSGAEEHEVPMVTLDSEPMPGRVAFMKIDVEGHELALLRGARALLGRDAPTLLVEVEARHAASAVSELAALLLDEFGYSASELTPSGIVPVDRGRWTAEALNHRADGEYTNNFLFRR